jgi:hypothetical protein
LIAIKLPANQSAARKPSFQIAGPPELLIGRMIEACFKLMASHLETYRQAVLAENGRENAEKRIANAVAASVRPTIQHSTDT